MMLSLNACAPSGSGVVADVCPAWLRHVAPIRTNPPDTDQTKRLVWALNEAGEAVGCW